MNSRDIMNRLLELEDRLKYDTSTTDLEYVAVCQKELEEFENMEWMDCE